MEFVQFHPTGMVWPLSVRGILVTEGVRGEGGVLKNSRGERFMFRYIPEMFRRDFADTEEEADRWVAEVVAGRKAEARRPPELLTRDVVARAIAQEVREGRGSPHGGAFLDIASRRKPEEIRKKLPSMYQQFLELADVDITREPMEVGPTTHYMMGGGKVGPETQAATVPGLFAAGEVAGGLPGANRLGGNSLSDLLVFGRRAGLGAATYARAVTSEPRVDAGRVDAIAAELLAPFERRARESPYAVQDALQDMMGTYVGIARSADDLQGALAGIEQLRARAARAGGDGNRQYNPGWHTARDLRNLLTASEALTRAERDCPAGGGGGRARGVPGGTGAPVGRARVAVGLQGRAVRLVQRRGERQAAAHVHDADGPLPAWRGDHAGAHEGVPGHEGSRVRRVLELRGEQARPGVPAAGARARRHLAHAAGRHRSGAGVSQVHRMLPLPGRLSGS